MQNITPTFFRLKAFRGDDTDSNWQMYVKTNVKYRKTCDNKRKLYYIY